jgi:subtilase family serine protease/flagellar hook assembly protein FlgD/fibronectin type 3 domain-containing protein
LAEHNPQSQARAPALQLVGAQQNSDGSFGVITGGRGRALPTLRAAAFVAGFGGSDIASTRDAALTWIGSKQLADGSIGEQGQSSLAASLEMFALAGRLRPDPLVVANLRNYVVGSQQRLGDWGGSVYLTATAVLAYAHDQQANLQVSGAPSVLPVQPHDGDRAILSAVVANKGNAPVPASIARWYDGDPDQGGVQIGTDLAVPALAAASFATIKQPWDTTGRAGDHLLWLVLDPENAIIESSEQDNRSSFAVAVLAPSNLPDLALDAVDFALDPAAVSSLPSSVHLAGILRNIGAAAVNRAVVRLYAKPDITHAIATTTVDVPGRGNAPIAVDFTVSAPATLNLLVRADPDNAVAEANETNNDASLVLPFGQALDLQVTAADLSLASPARAGQDVSFDAVIHNVGTVDSPPAVLHAEVVQNNISVVVFDAPVQFLAGQAQTRRITWRAVHAGAAQLRVALDPSNQVVETREDNNAAQLDFSIVSPDQPELTFGSDSLAFIPIPALQGQPLIASLLVRNLSSVASGSFRIALYAADPRSAAPVLGSAVVSSVAGSNDLAVNINVADLGLSGDQTLYAFIDADNQIAEADETNNVIITPLHVVPLPDVVVSVADIALTPALPMTGQPVHALVTVRNTGGQEAQNVVVRLQENNAAQGISVGADQTLGVLPAGSAATVSWNWILGVLPDARTITALADPDHIVREGSEDNNVATLPFDVQDGDFFVNQRYISPNGDGVQDETAIVFVLPVAGPAELDVVNGAQYTVRHFINVPLNDGLRGQAIWDGRDDLGRIVPDGDYRLAAIDSAGQSHAGALVTVDNNLSSALEAYGTPLGVFADLLHDSNGNRMTAVQIPPTGSPVHDQIFGLWESPTTGRGLYRAETMFPNGIPVISGDWVARFREAHNLDIAYLDEFHFSPDGRLLAIKLYGRAASGDRMWILVTGVDQVDAPRVLAAFDPIQNLQVFGFFDADTFVVGPNQGGVLQTIDVATTSSTPWRTWVGFPSDVRVDILPAGLIATTTDINGVLQATFFPRSVEKAAVPLNTEGPMSTTDVDDGPDYVYSAQLSSRQNTLAVYERNAQQERITFVDLESATRKILIETPAVLASGRLTGNKVSVPRYGLGWLTHQSVLLVQDAVTHAVIRYSETGAQLSSTSFPAPQRIGQYIIQSHTDGLINSDDAHIFPEVPFDLSAQGCNFNVADPALGLERHIYDPTRNQLFLWFGETIVHEERPESFTFVFTDGIRDYFDLDLDTGKATLAQPTSLLPLISPADTAAHPLRQSCVDAPPADAPALILDDGAQIRVDGSVWTLSRGVLSKTWDRRVAALWPDDTRMLLDDGTTFSSLLNLVAVLNARTLGRGVELTGVATDRNFANYQLDWARIETPNDWQVLSPATTTPVLADEFLTWVPPQSGTYLVRLTVVDKAGNRHTATATAVSLQSSVIDTFSMNPRYLSPNGDGVQDQLAVQFRVRQPATLSLHISDASGNLVRTIVKTYDTSTLGSHRIEWDGRADDGQVVADGRYRVELDGFSGWAVVDNSAPILSGTLRQAYQPAHDVCTLAGCERPPIIVQPSVVDQIEEAELQDSAVEFAPKSGGAWMPAALPATPASMGAYKFRIRASDKAGNTSVLALGDGEEQLIITQVTEREVAYQTPPVTNVLDINSPPPIEAIPVDQDHAVAIAFSDESGLLQRVAVESALASAPDQWTEIGIAGIPESCTKGKCRALLDSTGIPLGANVFVRLRGEHLDGSRLYSNQAYVHVGGIEAPFCGPIVSGHRSVYATEHFAGPLSAAALHMGGLTQNASAPILDGTLVFLLDSYSSGALSWVEGVDNRGLKHTSPKVTLDCPDTNPDANGGAAPIPFFSVPVITHDQCDGQPSDLIALGVGPFKLDDLASSEPVHVVLRYVDGITNAPVVLLDETVPQGQFEQVPQVTRLSTANWPDGLYDAFLEISAANRPALSFTTKMPVLKEAPQINVDAPKSGDRVCSAPGGTALAINITVASPADSSYHIDLGAGEHPVSWECLKDDGAVYPPHATVCGNYLTTKALFGNTHFLDGVNIENDVRSFNGISSIRLKSAGWSGGTTCVQTSVYLDSDVELTQRQEPATYLPIRDVHQVLGVSLRGDEAHAQASLYFRATEAMHLTSRVFEEGSKVALDTLNEFSTITGDVDLRWNGRIHDAAVPDGAYAIKVDADDGCAHLKTFEYHVLVDSTPPNLSLAGPAVASTSAPIIEFSGSAYDVTGLANWSLDIALSSSPGSWQTLASGTSPISTPQLLTSWSRGSLTGPIDVRLSATDILGNRSETHLALTLLVPAKLIGAAELQPPLFSPNGDGFFDASRLQIGLLQAANVAITANDGALYTGPASAGSTGFVWNGKDGAGHPLPDGVYPIVISATDPNGIAPTETATLSATIDDTPPLLTILLPTGAFAGAEALVRFHAEDVHFAHYLASLTRITDRVEVASVEGSQGGNITVTSLHGMQEGSYALHVAARDGAGNVTTRDTTFQLDSTAPAVLLSTPTDDALVPSVTATSVKGSIDDAHLASWTLAVAPVSTDTWTDLAQGSANVEVGELLSWTPHLSDGRYRLRVRGVDQAGNITDAIHTVNIDGTAPVAHIAVPANADIVRGSFEIDGTATDAHFASYRISILPAAQLEGGHWSDVFVGTTAVDSAKLTALTLNLPDDNYVLRLLVTDKAGLSSSDQVTVRIDAQPPAAPIGLIGHVENHRDAILDWSAVSTPDLRGYHIYRGGARITASPISGIHYTDANAPQARLQYYVTAADMAGNESVPSNTVTLLIDHTPPQLTLVHPVTGERVRGIYDIVGTAYSHDDFKQYHLTAQATAPAGLAATLASSTLPVQGQVLARWNTLTLDPETAIHLHLEAEDTSGNIAAADAEVVVDNIAPAAPTGLTATVVGVDAQTHWNPNTESDLLGYLLYRDNVLVNAASAFLPADLRPFALADTQDLDKAIPDGVHTYLVYAIDRAGNVSAPSAPATLDPIDNHPPSMRIEQPASGAKLETSIDLLATSADGDIAQVQFAWRARGDVAWNDFGAPLTSAPYRTTWIPPHGTPYGNYQIRPLARDQGGQLDPAPPFVDVVYADLTPPDKLLHTVARAEGGSVHVTWDTSTAADLAGYKVYRGFLLLTAAPIATLTYEDPGLDDGGYSYAVTAVDNYGNESVLSDAAIAHVFTIALQQPYSPVATPATDITGVSARSGTVTVHDEMDAGSSDRNAGATAADGTLALTGQPLGLGGNHLTVRVTDDGGNSSRPAELWVDRGNVPAVPTGAAASVDDHSVHLAWNANVEPEVLGYRVFRDGHTTAADIALSELPTASTVGGLDPGLAVDGNPQTAWQAYGVFTDPDASPNDPALELAWPQPHLITAASLRWLTDEFASGNVDFYAWSGHAWIRVARVRGVATSVSSIVLAQPYRTDKVRLVVHGAMVSANLQLLQLAEIGFLERPVVGATNYAEAVLDGTYYYQLSAISNLAFESPLSDEVSAVVGDPQGNTGVVLSGTLIGNNASLSWTASASSAVVRYELRRNGTLVHSSGSDVRAYVDNGLQNGTYAYVVLAYDAVGNASPPSNSVTLTVSGVGPGVPIGLNIAAPQNGAELDGTWQPGVGTAPAYYVVRRASSENGPYERIAEPANASYADKGVINGTTYWYTVEAVDGLGYVSGQSAPVSGVPNDHLPPPPPLLTYPTMAPYPLALRAAQTNVCGVGEPGSAIDIAQDGTPVASAVARASASSNVAYVSSSTRLLAGPDGRSIAQVRIGGALDVQRIGDATIMYTSDSGTRLQSWAAHGATLYYVAAGNDEIFRWELGQPPQPIVHPFAQLSALSVSADEATLATAAIYTDGSSTQISGVWLFAQGSGLPRRIGALDPAALNTEHSLTWSPDGRYLAVQDGDGTTRLVKAATAEILATFATDPAAPPTWIADGQRLAFARLDGAGGDEIVLLGADTQAQTVLQQNVASVHGLAWSPANDAFAITLDLRIEIRSSRDATLLFAIDTGGAYPHVEWTAAGRVVANDGANVRYIDLPGWFCADAQTLHVGANRFNATAVDSAGHRSLPSAVIDVDAPSDHLPDLAVSAADILFLPASGKPEQNYSALITLHNLGTADVEHPTLSARLTAPDGSRRTLQPINALSALQAGGGIESTTFVLGTLAQAGSYRLDVTTDPDRQLHELDETNNTASATLILSADGKPALELNLSSSIFAPGANVTGEVAVTNAGSTFDGTVRLSVLDASDAIVANVGDYDVRGLAFGQRWSAPVLWNAHGIFAGSYKLRAQLLGQDGSAIAERVGGFAIATARHLQLTLTPEVASLPAGDAALLHSGVVFSDGNALLSGAVLQLTALDGASHEIWSSQQALGTLLPGYALARDDTWYTSGLAPGVYTLRLRIVAPDLAQSVDTSLTLTAPAPGAALSGMLSFDPGTTLIGGESTLLHYSLANTGGTMLTNVQSRVRLVTAPGQLIVSEHDEQFDLAVNASHVGSLTLMAPPLSLVSHVALFEARLPNDPAGQWRLLAQQGFAVIDLLPPQITVLSPPSDAAQPAVVPLRAAIVDLHSAVASAQVSVDGGNWQPISAGSDGAYARGLSGLSDGLHTLSVRASDTWGNQAQSMALPFTVDATPPAIVIAGVADGDVLNHSVAPSVTITDAHLADTDVRLNGVPFVSGSSIEQDGSYVLTAKASDVARNQTIASVRFAVDRTAPFITITAPHDGETVSQSAIEVDVLTEPAANIRLTTGAFDASAVATPQGRAAFPGVPLVPGVNVLHATATDRAGNASSATTVTVIYQQNTIAQLTGSLQPAGAEVAYGAALDVGVLAQNPNGITLPARSLRVTLRDGIQNVLASQSLTHDFAANETFSTLLTFPTTGWPLGYITLTLELDVSGTWTLLDTKQVPLVDRSPPLVFIAAPLEASVLHGPIVVHGSVSDSLSAIANVELSLDAGDWNALVASGGNGYASAALNLADGDHQVELRAHDAGGNTGMAGPVRFAIDSVAPLINIAGVADGDLLAHAVTPSVIVNDAHLSSSDVRLNGQLYVSGGTIAASGDYQLDVSAVDAAGNQSAQTVHFTLDLAPPAVTFTAPPPNTTVGVAKVDVAGRTEAGATVHFVAGSFSLNTAADAAGLFAIAAVPLQPGSNLFSAHATDRAGNTGADATLDIVYVNVGLSGHIGSLPPQAPRGAVLDVSYLLHNTGTVELTALPLRVELRSDADGNAVLGDDFTTDLSTSTDTSGVRHLDTASVRPGSYTAVLLADLPPLPGPGGWLVLDSVPLQLFLDPCRLASNDMIFASGFDASESASSESIFCNGFETILPRASASTSRVAKDLLLTIATVMAQFAPSAPVVSRALAEWRMWPAPAPLTDNNEAWPHPWWSTLDATPRRHAPQVLAWIPDALLPAGERP